MMPRRHGFLVGLVCAGFLVFPGWGLSDPLAPEMLPPGDRAWLDLYLLELAGAIPVGLTSMRPVSRALVAVWIADASGGERAEPASLARLQRSFARELRRIGRPGPFTETRPAVRLRGEISASDSLALDGARTELRTGPTLSLEVRSKEGETEFTDSTRAGLYGVYSIGRTAAFQGELFIGRIEDGRQVGDPLIHGTDILYFLEDAGAAVATRDAWVRLARGRHHWGPGWGNSLLLDLLAAPIDFFEWGLSLPKGLRFVSWTGSLNPAEERGIAAHRLEVPLGGNLRLALSEGVRFKGDPTHPLYLLGLIPYTLVQRLDWQDTRADSMRMEQRNNVLAQAEIAWRPRPGSLAYLELLVDDLPARTGEMPARVGARFGVSFMPRVAGVSYDVGIEGVKISRYTYSVSYEGDIECDWIHQHRAIGEPNGPDQEAMRLRLGRSIGRDHRLEVEATYANRGAGRLGEAWVEGDSPPEHPTRRALSVSPPVERVRSLAARWSWALRDNLSLGADLFGALIRNEGNRSGDDRDERGAITVRGNWRY